MSQPFFANYFRQLQSKVAMEESDLELSAQLILSTKMRGGRVYLFGNGGSAAIASHVAIDFTKAAGIPSQCFNEVGLLTCFSNDFGYERWVEKALRYYAAPADLVILISSSGKSPNMLSGAAKARELNLPLITLTGFAPDNPLRALGDMNLWVDSRSYNIVENIHQIWLLAISDRLAGLDCMA
jgi:D-sedoheptulose 7-phosphate isomerase